MAGCSRVRAARPRGCLQGPARYGPRRKWEIVCGRFRRLWSISNSFARSSWRVRGGAPAGLPPATVSWRTPPVHGAATGRKPITDDRLRRGCAWSSTVTVGVLAAGTESQSRAPPAHHARVLGARCSEHRTAAQHHGASRDHARPCTRTNDSRHQPRVRAKAAGIERLRGEPADIGCPAATGSRIAGAGPALQHPPPDEKADQEEEHADDELSRAHTPTVAPISTERKRASAALHAPADARSRARRARRRRPCAARPCDRRRRRRSPRSADRGPARCHPNPGP